jgi:hypothetical protein
LGDEGRDGYGALIDAGPGEEAEEGGCARDSGD